MSKCDVAWDFLSWAAPVPCNPVLDEALFPSFKDTVMDIVVRKLRTLNLFLRSMSYSCSLSSFFLCWGFV